MTLITLGVLAWLAYLTVRRLGWIDSVIIGAVLLALAVTVAVIVLSPVPGWLYATLSLAWLAVTLLLSYCVHLVGGL